MWIPFINATRFSLPCPRDRTEKSQQPAGSKGFLAGRGATPFWPPRGFYYDGSMKFSIPAPVPDKPGTGFSFNPTLWFKEVSR